MLERVKLITSRRAYEFRSDDLRLSALSTKPVQEQIQQLFQFQVAVMGVPAPTFGDVPTTYPPGFVFDVGVWISPDEQLVPIRFLHFEQRRIVIDVAGPSSAITAIFERLRQFLSGLHIPDGSPVIGEPEHVLDYSEITAKYSFSLEVLIPKPLRKLLDATVKEKGSGEDWILLPTLAMQMYPIKQELIRGPVPNDTRVFTFALRAGTRPDEHVYFSGAPLVSEEHLVFLEELASAFTP
jgi:hypothetical protein